MKLTDAEWTLFEVLWSGKRFALKEITKALSPTLGWNRNTVYTYLIRMEAKGMVAVDRDSPKPYRAVITREECAREERQSLLNKVYGGAAGDLIAAFLKESSIDKKEADRLRKMLDEMEV
ncbi:MAG: BlaI/MecI/CopY family transcriptional regulator [Clostridia bacterium]|nr:BlaI/MecI/CopY family transcriptional regulator [Clostridia bacterium]